MAVRATTLDARTIMGEDPLVFARRRGIKTDYKRRRKLKGKGKEGERESKRERR